LDGNEKQVYTEIAGTPYHQPYGLAIDQDSRTLYASFPENGPNEIWSFNLNQPDGSDNPNVFSTGVEYPWDLTFVPTTSPIPEPSRAILSLAALGAVVMRRRRLG